MGGSLDGVALDQWQDKDTRAGDLGSTRYSGCMRRLGTRGVAT